MYITGVCHPLFDREQTFLEIQAVLSRSKSPGFDTIPYECFIHLPNNSLLYLCTPFIVKSYKLFLFIYLQWRVA